MTLSRAVTRGSSKTSARRLTAENVRQALGDLGSRSARLTTLEGRIEDASLRVQSLLSSVRDVDFSQAVVDLSMAQTTLQTVQNTGARMLQNSLLNFLR